MSTISDALKDAKQAQILIELDFGGLVKRYAMKDIVVPYSTGTDKLFEAAILHPITFGATFDPRAFGYNYQDVNVSIANKCRLQDEETRQKLDGGTGCVYVWVPGLDWSDIETNGLIFKGVFEKQQHTRDTYTFTLRDFATTRFKTIPETMISSDTWGDNIRVAGGAGSPIESPQPLLFGSWTKGIPIKCVDTVNFYYLAHFGKSKATEANYNAGTLNVYDKDGATIGAANYTFYPAGIDSQGNLVAYFDFVADQSANEPLNCSIYGIYDGSGIITGTADALIEHPSDIVTYIMNNHSNLATDEIHTESLKSLKNILPGLKFATLINSQAAGNDIIDRLCKQCIVAKKTIGGKVGVVTLNAKARAMGSLGWSRNIVGHGETFTKTPADDIKNNIRARYSLNPTNGQYEGEIKRNRTNNNTCKRSYHDYGEQAEYVFDLPDVHEEATAIALVNRLIDLKGGRHDIVEIEVPYWEGIDYREGDAAALTLRDGPSANGNGWTDETCILLERRFGQHSIRLKWWRVNT